MQSKALWLMFNLVDGMTTVAALRVSAVELFPVMSFIAGLGPGFIILAKIAGAAMALGILYMVKLQRLLSILNWAMVAILTVNLLTIYFLV